MSSPRAFHYGIEGGYSIVSLTRAAALAAALSGCSAQPQGSPVVAGPVSSTVQQTEECTTLANILCGAMSMLSGDTAIEQGPTCSAYRDRNGTLVQTCGTAQAKAPPVALRRTPEAKPPTSPVEANKAAAGSVRLSWSDNSNNENNFVVERCDQAKLTTQTTASCIGGWKVIGIVGANTTSYDDRTVLANHTYIYRVKATNNAGSSTYTNEMSTTTQSR